MHIEIAEATFKRLQKHSEPLVDTVESVIIRIIDHYEKGSGKQKESPAIGVHSTKCRTDSLRGLQRELWELIIVKMPLDTFTLRDVYAREEPLEKLRPNVKDLRASIRGTLETLRDKSYIEFIDNRGSYRRLI